MGLCAVSSMLDSAEASASNRKGKQRKRKRSEKKEGRSVAATTMTMTVSQPSANQGIEEPAAAIQEITGDTNQGNLHFVFDLDSQDEDDEDPSSSFDMIPIEIPAPFSIQQEIEASHYFRLQSHLAHLSTDMYNDQGRLLASHAKIKMDREKIESIEKERDLVEQRSAISVTRAVKLDTIKKVSKLFSL
jgi:hypothetical protein